MRRTVIYYTPEFLRLWKRIPKGIKQKATKREDLFRQNPFHPHLKTHKLKGMLAGFYSFSIDYYWRIAFHFEKSNIYFDTVGTHAIYR